MMFLGQYQGRRVLVTGHTGFKGSWLCEWLVGLGADVSGYSLGMPYTPCHFEALTLTNRMNHYEGDVRNLSDLLNLFEKFKPEVVFHLAAQSLVRRSFEEPTLTIETNTMGTVNVLEAIRKTPSVVAAVMVTSDKCYQNNGWDFGYRETDVLGGKDPYSASKACAELISYTYIESFFSQENSPKIATARAGNVIGGGDWAPNRIVPDCIRAWNQNTPAMIRNPEHTRPWQHVLEPLSGYLWLGSQLLLKNSRVQGEAFNFGPNNSCNQSVRSLVTEMKKNWNCVSWEFSAPDKSGVVEAPLLQLNCDKALQRLKWRPTLTYEEGIRLTVEWYQKYYVQSAEAPSTTRQQIHFYEAQAREKQLVWAQ